MPYVKVQNSCSCFFKSGLSEQQFFVSKDEAKAEAESMLAHMQQKFCKKHDFILNESVGNYTISIRPRQR